MIKKKGGRAYVLQIMVLRRNSLGGNPKKLSERYIQQNWCRINGRLCWGTVLLNLDAVSRGLYVCACLPALWAYCQMCQHITFAGDVSKRTLNSTKSTALEKNLTCHVVGVMPFAPVRTGFTTDDVQWWNEAALQPSPKFLNICTLKLVNECRQIRFTSSVWISCDAHNINR